MVKSRSRQCVLKPSLGLTGIAQGNLLLVFTNLLISAKIWLYDQFKTDHSLK